MLFRLWLSFQRQSSQCVFCSLVALNLRGQAGAPSESLIPRLCRRGWVPSVL